MRILLFLFLTLSTNAFAQEGMEQAVSITEKECKKLIRLNSFNSAEYVPGVDMRGNKVVPADLENGRKLDLPDEITFSLGIDIAEKYDLGPGFYGKADLGEVKVKGRHVYWNGKKLHQSEHDKALAACREQYGEK